MSDFNDALASGWYQINGVTKNAPTMGVTYSHGHMVVSADTNRVRQDYFPHVVGKWPHFVRWFYRELGWQPWEVVNPPLELGVEYRTIERYGGKPVYEKLVDFGALPNASFKYVVVDNTAEVFRVSGRTVDGRTLPGTVGVEQTGMITCAGVGAQVQIVTYADQSSLSAYVCAWYIKTTD